MRLLIATANRGKLREIREILRLQEVEALGLADLPDAPAVEEDADSFLGNARKKAWTIAGVKGLPVLADDSGLTVEALGGRPGVLSARFAGPSANDEENNRKLLAELAGVAPQDRRAAFVCAMVLAIPGGIEYTTEGRLEGRVLENPRGVGGFGYDPLFLIEELGLTLAELDISRKNCVSHRGKALRAMLPRIEELRLRA